MMARPLRWRFLSFPEILRAKTRDLKTPHNTFWDCRAHYYAFSRQPLWKQLQRTYFTKYGFTI